MDVSQNVRLSLSSSSSAYLTPFDASPFSPRYLEPSWASRPPSHRTSLSLPPSPQALVRHPTSHCLHLNPTDPLSFLRQSARQEQTAQPASSEPRTPHPPGPSAPASFVPSPPFLLSHVQTFLTPSQAVTQSTSTPATARRDSITGRFVKREVLPALQRRFGNVVISWERFVERK